MESEKEKDEEKKEKAKQRRRARLIVRVGEFLISHSVLVSVLCCTAGIVTLFLLPVLAKNTYVSENALMPGSANPTFSGRHMREGDQLIKAIISQTSSDVEMLETPRLIEQYMSNLGAEVYYHKFYEESSQFHPFHFFSFIPTTGMVNGSRSSKTTGINTVGIIRAPRGDGKESIVIVTPYNSRKIEINEVLSLGLAYSVFSLLSQVSWLAKDIVWVAADSQYGEHASVAAWLREYYNPVFSGDAENTGIGIHNMCIERNTLNNCKNNANEGSTYAFKRAGTMAAGLVLKVVERKEGNEMDSVTIYSEASNGQMPNLDLINIVHYLAVHRQAFHVKVGVIGSLLNSEFLKVIGKALEWISRTAGSLNPKWSLGIYAAEYVVGTATLASSMYTQALGIPTGPHGAFRDYQVDAITLEISPRAPVQKDFGQSAVFIRGGRLIEGVIRSVNNLLEKFHQSFFLYLLTSPNKFVSVGVYMIAFALLAVPLPIVAAALFSGSCSLEGSKCASELNSDSAATEQAGVSIRSWRWIHAAKVVFTVHLWAVVVSLLPYIISQFHTTPGNSMLVWISLSVVSLLLLFLVLGQPNQFSEDNDWVLLKAVMIAALAIGLSLMSIINFATAQIGAVFLVPMCLMVRPLRRCNLALLNVCNVLTGVSGFPLAAMLIVEGLEKGFSGACIGDFWEWTETLLQWNSATYLYVIVVHLPSWVLCMYVLFHQRACVVE